MNDYENYVCEHLNSILQLSVMKRFISDKKVSRDFFFPRECIPKRHKKKSINDEMAIINKRKVYHA